MIIAQQLRKRYNGVDALNLPSITIQEGETFGLVGNNGAGKTTFFSLILDLIMPTEGMVLSRGTNVMRSEHWKEYTGAYLDERFLIDFLTPEEYFEFIGGVTGSPRPGSRTSSRAWKISSTEKFSAPESISVNCREGIRRKLGSPQHCSTSRTCLS
jgi:ABC-type multidrug transport system ATPase subunit